MSTLTALPALSIRPPEGPLDQYSKLVQLKGLLANQQYQQQMRPLEVQRAQQENQAGALELQQKQMAMQDQQTIRQAMSETPGSTWGDILPKLRGKINPSTWANLYKADIDTRKDAAALSKDELENAKAQHDQLFGIYQNLMTTPDAEYVAKWPAAVQAIQQVPGVKMQLNPQQPVPKQQLSQFGPLFSMNEAYINQELEKRQKEAEATVKEQQAAMGPQPTEAGLAVKASQGDAAAEGALARLDKSKRESRPINNIMTRDDAKDIADAIENGDQAPTVQGLYRNAGPVRAELARRGVPIAKMETDWKATQRYVASLNGPQQLRLNQSIASAAGLLPKIEDLYSEWKTLAPVSGYKIANHAALVAMRNLPGRAGAVATALDTQIAELTADLGNIYMGGNSPTDQALKLGAVALKSDWGPAAFEEGIRQAKLNVGIRQNSIKHGMPQGMSGTTNYFGGGQDQGGAPLSTPGGETPSGGKRRVIDMSK